MRLIILFSSLLWAAPLLAHDLQYRSDSAQATVLTLFYTDQKAFSYEQYELYRPGQNIPTQVGRTDDQGRLVFLPDQAGAWRVKVFSEDGHGLDTKIQVTAPGQAAPVAQPLFGRYPRLIVGIALIFGLFGLVSLLMRSRRGAD